MGETPVTAEARGATASIEADLTRIWESARALGIGPPDTTLAGTVTGDLRGALADGVLDLPSLKLTSRNLRVQQGDRKLSQESVELSGALQADLSERRLSITGARVAAPAGHLDLPDLTVPDWRSPATGTAASFSAKVNLERLYADAGGLVTMPDDLSVAGELSLSGNIGAAEQGAAGRKVTANAHLTDLNMFGSEGGLLREESIEMAFETIANPPVEGQALRLKDISLAAVGGLLPAELTASEVALGETMEQSRVADLSLTSQASLAPLLDISRRFGAVPHDLTGSGALDLTCAGSLDGGVLEVKQFDFAGRDLQVARGEKTFREPELRLSGTGRADLKKRSARLESATLDSSVGSAGATGVVVPDWSRLPQGVAGEVTGGAELARVLEAARPFAELPEGMQAEGTLDLASAFSVDREGVNADGRLSVRPLKVRKGRSPWFTEDSIELSADARIPHGRETVNFESLRVSSEPGMLRAEASGRLEDWSGARHLMLEGTATPDWSRIGALVKAFTGKDIEMEGAEKRPFKVDTRLGETDPAEMLRQTTADAGLQVRRFRYAGVEAQDVELKVETMGEQLDLGATGQLNQGPFTFGPVLRVAEGEPALVLPGPGVVLSGAQITDEAANALLGRALPIFRNPVDVEGVADLAFREFNVPLTGDLQRAVVDAQITLRGASVASSGALKSLLGLIGLDDETLQVPDQDVRVRLRDGRIHHGKMPLKVREHTVVSSGSVGLDKTLDLLVELPVTRELVDSDSLYDILEGQSIKVRLRGTLDNPQFNRDIIKDNLRDLIRGSAGGLLRRLLE